MSVIDEVKQKTDIVEIIGQDATLTKSGRNFRALCPFHSEKRPSFYVYPEQQSWHCFGACNTGGDIFSFVMKKENMDFGEALRLLAERAGVTIPTRYEQDSSKDERDKLREINKAAARYYHNLLLNSPAGESARAYLGKRGFSVKSIADFQLGYSLNSWEAIQQHLAEKGYSQNELLEAGLIITTDDGKTHDRFRNRLIFPISDARGHITGFGARVLDDSLPKYVNSPQTPLFDKSGTLYGLNLAAAAIRQQELAIIVEGYMDVITAHQNGITNVVASMGTSVTEKQVNILKRLSKNMALALDADAAGEEAMLRCVDYENTLSAEVRVIIMPQGKDPDDVIKEDAANWQHLVDNALPVIDYTFNMVASRLDLTTARDKSIMVDNLLPIVAGIKDSTRQDHYLSRLSRLTGTTYHNLELALNKYKSARKSRKTQLEAVKSGIETFRVSPLEEYVLALMLQHPELKNMDDNVRPEYFENSVNREIFLAWQQTDDLSVLREQLDSAIYEHLDLMINRDIPSNQIELRYTDCILNLRKKYLQNLEAQRAEALAQETETGGTAAGLAKLEEDGIEVSVQLGKVFNQKARRV